MYMAGNGEFGWINENPASTVEKSLAPKDDIYRPRRSHNKSRNGCQNCRRLRIKCDEAKPRCGQCLHRKLHCEFLKTVSQQPASSIPSDSVENSTSRASAATQILAYLEEAGVPCSEFKNPIYKQGDGLELINHFLDTTIPWLGTPAFQRIIQKEGLQLALKSPYLLHAILVTSASHMSYLNPEQKKYEVAATIHYQHALTSYSTQLQTGVDAVNVDSVIGCGYLQTMLAFENISRMSAEQMGGEGGVAWLRAMQGIRVLQDTDEIRPHLEKSIWLAVFLESGGWEENKSYHADGKDDSWASRTSKALHTLCDLPFDSLGHENPYQQPLRDLCALMRSEIDHDTIGKFMVFIGKLPHKFVHLFEKSDSQAMLLMAYWCALICGADQWWIVRSASVECRRLCATLDSVAGPQIRDLLRFPANQCGYALRK